MFKTPFTKSFSSTYVALTPDILWSMFNMLEFISCLASEILKVNQTWKAQFSPVCPQSLCELVAEDQKADVGGISPDMNF